MRHDLAIFHQNFQFVEYFRHRAEKAGHSSHYRLALNGQ